MVPTAPLRTRAFFRGARLDILFLICSFCAHDRPGVPVPDGKRLFMLGKKMQRQVCEAARKIDVFLWVDATARTCQHLVAADAKHRATGLGLFGLAE